MDKPEEKLKEELKVEELLSLTLVQLIAKAWSYLGLVSHPETGKIKANLDQARLAIDSIEAIYPLIKDKLPEEDRKGVELELTNLRLNYVKQRSGK